MSVSGSIIDFIGTDGLYGGVLLCVPSLFRCHDPMRRGSLSVTRRIIQRMI